MGNKKNFIGYVIISLLILSTIVTATFITEKTKAKEITPNVVLDDDGCWLASEEYRFTQEDLRLAKCIKQEENGIMIKYIY